MTNPFIAGNPINPSAFIGRKKEIRQILSRLKTSQSVLVRGISRIGKTSLLKYIESELQENEAIIPYYIDSYTIPTKFTQSDFWKQVLTPIKERFIKHQKIIKTYELCEQNEFSTFVLEKLFSALENEQIYFVLLLDEFDSILEHETLHSAEFYGGLRSLATRMPALIITFSARQSLSVLNNKTQEFNRTGSPYFNFVNEIILGAFPEQEALSLIVKGNDKFNSEDSQFVQFLSGRYPYLLQSVCSYLWEAYINYPNQTDSEKRYEETFKQSLLNVQHTLENIWQHWTPETKIAILAIAVAQLQSLGKFRVSQLTKDLGNLQPELYELEQSGFIEKTEENQTGYKITSLIFLEWFRNEISRICRDSESVETWLRGAVIENFLSKKEKEQLLDIIKALVDFSLKYKETIAKLLTMFFPKKEP